MCDDEIRKLTDEVQTWLQTTSSRFLQDQRPQVALRVLGGHLFRVVMDYHPDHGNLYITAFSLPLEKACQHEINLCNQEDTGDNHSCQAGVV